MMKMRQKNIVELGITGILVIVMLFVFGNAAKKSRSRNIKDSRPKPADSAVIPLLQVNIPDSKGLYNLLEQQVKSIELKRDPFTAAPIISDEGLRSEISLTGILWDKAKPLAIIDGNVVKKGERVGNKTVVDIKRDRVILSDGEAFSEFKLAR